MVNQKNEIFSDKEGIIWVRLVGVQTVEDYIAIKEKVLELGSKSTSPWGVRVLVDVSQFRSPFITRLSGTGLVRELDKISRIAVVKANLFNALITQLLIVIGGIGHKLKIFKNEEEAVKWLNERGLKPEGSLPKN